MEIIKKYAKYLLYLKPKLIIDQKPTFKEVSLAVFYSLAGGGLALTLGDLLGLKRRFSLIKTNEVPEDYSLQDLKKGWNVVRK